MRQCVRVAHNSRSRLRRKSRYLSWERRQQDRPVGKSRRLRHFFQSHREPSFYFVSAKTIHACVSHDFFTVTLSTTRMRDDAFILRGTTVDATTTAAASVLMGCSTDETAELLQTIFTIPNTMDKLSFSLTSTCGLIAANNMFTFLKQVKNGLTVPEPINVIKDYLNHSSTSFSTDKPKTFYVKGDSIMHGDKMLKNESIARILSEGAWPFTWFQLMAPHLTFVNERTRSDLSETYPLFLILPLLGFLGQVSKLYESPPQFEVAIPSGAEDTRVPGAEDTRVPCTASSRTESCVYCVSDCAIFAMSVDTPPPSTSVVLGILGNDTITRTIIEYFVETVAAVHHDMFLSFLGSLQIQLLPSAHTQYPT